ncbi:hypothetical protein EYF80_013554 [Liparis tanakae]|uniref:Uncharacterized protein n=1 Tax=Liparis tanakae TaxID=230148 RepID=A0A4Z2IEC1_9TELE|nr:hypothetical protein EYF80_013554 [Liparis tanakae]
MGCSPDQCNAWWVLKSSSTKRSRVPNAHRGATASTENYRYRDAKLGMVSAPGRKLQYSSRPVLTTHQSESLFSISGPPARGPLAQREADETDLGPRFLRSSRPSSPSLHQAGSVVTMHGGKWSPQCSSSLHTGGGTLTQKSLADGEEHFGLLVLRREKKRKNKWATGPCGGE